MIPALDGVAEKLEQGALAADIGCGDGALVIALARAYPRSTFHAMDANKFAVAHVERRAAEAGLKNVRVFIAPAKRFPLAERYDLITTFDIQATLFLDYRTNVASYPLWQRWLRQAPPPTLVVWGKYDPSFTVAGATAYKDDVPNAEVHLLEAGISRSTKRPTRLHCSCASFSNVSTSRKTAGGRGHSVASLYELRQADEAAHSDFMMPALTLGTSLKGARSRDQSSASNVSSERRLDKFFPAVRMKFLPSTISN